MARAVMATLLAAAFVCAVSAEQVSGSVGGRGFGDTINWVSFSEGIAEAEATQKPAMVVIHKSWCGACKALGPKVAGNSEIAELAKDFVMINVHDDEEANTTEKFKPDGGYIPRVIFFDGLHGEVLLDNINKGGNPSYKYFHTGAESIVASMKEVKDLFQSEAFRSKGKAEL
uniref:Thioredoxin domain-containing protein n=1 Tax=Hemiselmis tepida TaxID=464990 RepID=A0A7S0VUY9_9CRYP|mmetsp:Transcript_26574/g.67505  ORF Transcript_26574/g.67505 Transcript_26574/m.67505 type:complete len:172 (+) Transcript_26574:29-544(+)